MKVLTATSTSQGQRPSDFTHCIDGEIVYLPPLICDRDRFDPDSGCGCGRSFCGANSHGGTTTAMVRDVDLTRDDVAEAVRSSLVDADMSSGAERIAEIILAEAERWPVGTVVEHRLGEVGPR